MVQLLTKEQPTDLALSTPRNKIHLLLVYHANTSFLLGGILVMLIVYTVDQTFLHTVVIGYKNATLFILIYLFF